jgi:adenylate cyclase
MLERLREDRAAVVALDVIFQGRKELRGDLALIHQMGISRGRLVLPFVDFGVKGGTATPELLGRSDTVERTGVTTGFAGLPNDPDGKERRADYEVAAQSSDQAEVTMQTFAFAAARVARSAGLSRQVDDAATARRRAWGGQTESTTWIDYRGPSGTFRRVSALDVLDGRAPARDFRNKAVVIGLVAHGSTDSHHRTPLDSAMPGAEVQANALDTMLRGQPLRDVPQLIDILAIVLLASLPAAAGLTRSRRTEAAAIAAVAIAFLAAAQLAFEGGRIIAIVVPLAALVAAASGVAALGAPRNVVPTLLRTGRP